jgi:hypothetical protein
MKAAKLILAIVLGIVALMFAWGLVTAALSMVIGLIKSIVGLAIGVAIIGGLGWVILRLIGRRPLTGSHHESLP